MSIRTGMFVLGMWVALVAPGCTPRVILRLSNPEQASSVTLFDQGAVGGTEDDTLAYLDQPARIAKVAAFFEERTQRWETIKGSPPVRKRYTISFRKGEEVTDRFWLEGSTLGLQTPSGNENSCILSEEERFKLLQLFADSPRKKDARG